MNNLKDSWIVVPAYNEEFVIGSVLEKLMEFFDPIRVVVVDDCSTDSTGGIANKLGCSVLTHPINLGQGAALQTGIDYALSKGAEFIVTFDSDGQHKVEDALRMLALLNRGDFKIICGSRFMGIKSQKMTFSKLLTLKMAVIFTRLTTGLNVTDAHNGLRVMTRSAAKCINIRQNRMAHASEIMGLIKNNNINYEEVPVEIIYTNYSIGKGQKISNSINIILDLLIGRFDK